MHQLSSAAPPALVFNANAPMALIMIRALHDRSIDVDALFGQDAYQDNYHYIIRASRCIRHRYFFSEASYDEKCLAALLEIAGNYQGKGVLFPASDRDVIFLSQHRDVLGPHYYFHAPPFETLNSIIDKIAFAGIAREYDLPVPETHTPGSVAELTRIAGNLPYPCILKPHWRQESWEKMFNSQKVVICRDAAQLISQHQKLANMGFNCLVQEIIPGGDKRIYCSFAILDRRSNPIAMHVCRKLRQSPPFFGNTVIAESVDSPAVTALTEEIGKKLKLSGYISIEFKHDRRDGRFKIMEITLGRPNRQVGITVSAGINIPWIWYQWLLKSPVQSTPDYRTGNKWLSEVMDLRSLPTYIFRHKTNPFHILKSYRHTRHFEIFSLRDMKPFLIFLQIGAARFWMKIRNRLWRSTSRLSKK